MKGERAYVKIDLDAIGHNAELVRKKVGPDVKILGVLKADAYGHGAVEVARYLQEKADAFAVATVEEALKLRAEGIRIPIMLLADEPEERFPELIKNQIASTVSTYRGAEALSKTAQALGMTATVHIALDTGMTRMGFRFTDNEEMMRAAGLPNLNIEGIFTHYSCADMADKSYSELQYARFCDAIDALENRGLHIPLRHISNSAGILEFDTRRCNMVRAGIVLYGLYPSEEVNRSLALKPAMSFFARVSRVMTVEAGHGVSYGATYVTKGPTVVATLSVGYADGYPRALSGKGRVLIRGRYAPVLGRVCMDQMMADVTRIPGVMPGDTVTLVGKDGDNMLSVEELADNAASFHYEFVCGIGMRVPRIYWKNGKEYKRVCYL